MARLSPYLDGAVVRLIVHFLWEEWLVVTMDCLGIPLHIAASQQQVSLQTVERDVWGCLGSGSSPVWLE
jgi:hypothetical protein